jgi:hypothetical protein
MNTSTTFNQQVENDAKSTPKRVISLIYNNQIYYIEEKLGELEKHVYTRAWFIIKNSCNGQINDETLMLADLWMANKFNKCQYDKNIMDKLQSMVI